MRSHLIASIAGVFAAAIVLLILAAILHAKPSRDIQRRIDLDGTRTQFGDVFQTKNRVVIVSGYWNASGDLKGDVLVLHWTNTNGGEPIVGLYIVSEEKAVGHWGYTNKVEVGERDICGEGLSGETLVFTKPAPEIGPLQ